MLKRMEVGVLAVLVSAYSQKWYTALLAQRICDIESERRFPDPLTPGYYYDPMLDE
jgi:hypothetical protein